MISLNPDTTLTGSVVSHPRPSGPLHVITRLHVLCFSEQGSQNVPCSTGVPLQAAVGLHHQDQVREQHHHAEVRGPCRGISNHSGGSREAGLVSGTRNGTNGSLLAASGSSLEKSEHGQFSLTVKQYAETTKLSSFSFLVASSVSFQHFSPRAPAVWYPGTRHLTSLSRSFSSSLR